MQVQVSIVLENTREFEQWIEDQGLVYGRSRKDVASQDIEKDVDPVAETPSEEPAAPVVQKKKRKRRTKAQIAADDAERVAAAAAGVARAEAAVKAADATGAAVESITPQPDPVETEEGETEYTLEDAMPILRAYIKEHNSASLIAKLKELGVERVNEIQPEKVSAFLAELVSETTAV